MLKLVGKSPVTHSLLLVVSAAAAISMKIVAFVNAEEMDEFPPDPPDTTYSTGAELMSSDALSRIPKKNKFRAYLPTSTDLSKNMPAPGNQGKIGACASWAIGYAARSFYISKYQNLSMTPEHIPSPRSLYHAARTDPCPGGTTFEENARALERGVPSLKDVPYSDTCSEPTKAKTQKEDKFRIDGFASLSAVGTSEIKGQLAVNNPVVISFRVNSAFDKLRRHRIFNDKMRNFRKGGQEQWHALAVVGYDDELQAVRIINSWGRGWGNAGYAWISYDMINDPYWTSEAFVLDVEKASSPPTPSDDEGHTGHDFLKEATKDQQLDDLKHLRCSNINITSLGQRQEISGFVGSKEDWDRVQNVAEQFSSVSVKRLSLAPWPACEVLETLSKPAAQSDPPTVFLDTGDHVKQGDTLSFKVKSPSLPSYLYISYLQADGSIINLIQPRGQAFSQTDPNSLLSFGDGKEGRQKFVVSPPAGTEFIIALSSRSPLFETPLAVKQTDREYLTALRRALIYKPNPSTPDRAVSAAIATVQTGE